MATSASRAGSAAACLVALLVLSCGPSREDRPSGARETRSAVISDQVHNGGVPGFFWLPPMVPATAYGEFKAGLAPEVVVERLPVGSAPPVARFGAADVKTDGASHYMVNWDTKASGLDPAVMYRIRVVLGWFELGYADVDVVSSGSELRNVASGEHIPLLDGRTLPVKFRIEPAAMLCPDRGPCQAKDQCHLAGTCDPFTGTCSDPAKPDGAPCDDGDLCTQTDACQVGACAGTNPVVCTASDACHDAGTCDASTGLCSDPLKPDDTPCDDGDLCTRTDACQAGTCTGTDAVVCTASNQCHDVGVCEPLTGLCSDPEKPNDTPCDDEDLCTQTDTCQGGACTGADPVVCTASDQCHDPGACDPASGACSDPPKADGAPCSDGTLCTRSDTCQGGSCVGMDHVVCTAADQCHDAGSCDPLTGGCSSPAKPDGAPCEDGNPCTAAGACPAGRWCTPADRCGPGRSPCPDGAECVGGLCTGCCTATDACFAGACVGSTSIACDDGDACTRNGCDATAAAEGGVTGCTYVPDRTLAGCETPPPPANVTIVGLASAVEGFFANQRLNFSVKLAATADRPDYEVELLLFPVTAPDDTTTYPGVRLGTARIPLVAAGEHDYWVELDIPATLQPGSWEIAAHEYPVGEQFYPSEDDPPLVLVVEAASELPVLDVTALRVAQAALLVDPDSTVVDPAVYRDVPFAANLDLVAQNHGATGVPVVAQLVWEGAPVPLRIWDPVQRRWVETLVLGALQADAPRGVYAELALAEADAAPIRAYLEALPPDAPPTEAQIVLTVNGDGSVPEAECVVDDPNAPVNCRHAALATAILYVAPPPSEPPAPFAMALGAAGNTSPLRYEKSWSKTIGNDWARAGIAFSGFAQLSQNGYEASARGNAPMRLLSFPEFQIVDATASAKALVDGTTSIGVTVKAIGITVYDRGYGLNPARWDLGSQFPSFQKEISYSTTIVVYVVPVTFTLGASGELGLGGELLASFTAGDPDDTAALTLSGGPYANVGAFGRGAVGVAWLSAGVQVTLKLVDANLTAAATGSLTLHKRTDVTPVRLLEIRGGLNERLSYATSFLNGTIGVVVTYPAIVYCRVGRLSFPCGVTTVTAEQVFASWPGYSYAGDILNLSQSLFTIDLCTESTVSCTGRCGTFDDGCAGVNCGSCPAGQTCTAAQVCCSPATCAGRCGVFADGCGGTLSCGGCLAGQTCTADHVCCMPTTCGDRCGEIADGCGGTLSCGGCPAGQDCNADHLCACVPTMTCEGRCGEIDNGCGVTLVCDGCSPGWTCTIDHVCTCTPTATCDGRCGVLADGCGGTLSCGGCPAGQVCRANACETATELFSDDFEAYAAGTYPSGGWYLLWSGAGDAHVVEGIAHGGNKSFMLPGETNWVRADGVALDLTGRDRLTYRAAAMVPAGSATGATLGLFERIGAFESRERNAVFLDPGNEIVVAGAVWGHTGIIAQPDTWYVVQADIDYAAQTLDVWIDGVKVLDDLPAWPKVEPNVFSVGTLWSGTACCLSTSYFDDVLLY